MTSSRSGILSALPLLALLSWTVSAQEPTGGDWPQWRGPTRDGLAPGPTWPADLGSEHLTEAWRLEGLGPSYSGPVCDARRVYVTETVDETSEVVRAVDRATGEVLWETGWKGAMEVPFFAARNGSWIRSTPAVDADSLYVAGMCDVLVRLDVESGDVRWTVDFKERFGTPLPPFGCVPSPLLTDELVILQGADSIVALRKSDGETVWRGLVAEGGMESGGAFSSPVLAPLAGIPQLVVQSRLELSGVDLSDGSRLWTVPVETSRGMNILTPTVFGDGVFTSAYGGRSRLFEVSSGDAGFEVAEAWSVGAQGYMTSPVVVDGHAYLFLRSNRFACFDLEAGEERWTSPPTGDSYWSLAVQGERILALSDSGTLRLVAADPGAYRVLSEREVLDEETWAHVAPAGGQVLVRGLETLVALDWK